MQIASKYQHLANPKEASQSDTRALQGSQHRRCENSGCIKCCSGTASAAKPVLRAAHRKTNVYYTFSPKRSGVLHWHS